MNNNQYRLGNFTSSNNYKLFESKKVRETYINEKRIERKIQRSINVWEAGKSAAWGEIIESYVFQKKLDTSYKLISEITRVHPELPFWSGSPDLETIDSVADIKCYEPKSFCQYADVLMSNDLNIFKEEFPKEYWQLISNACILEKENAEAILYLPYYEDIIEIQKFVDNADLPNPHRYRFIVENEAENLPYQNVNNYYKDLIRFKFKVPKIDKEELKEAVINANKEI